MLNAPTTTAEYLPFRPEPPMRMGKGMLRCYTLYQLQLSCRQN